MEAVFEVCTVRSDVRNTAIHRFVGVVDGGHDRQGADGGQNIAYGHFGWILRFSSAQ
jgi:hypothetical protein